MPTDTATRSAWHPRHLLLVLAVWLVTAGNLPLWMAVARLPETQGWAGLGRSLLLGGVLLAFTVGLLALVVWPRWLKPVALLLLVIATSSSYFMASYGVVIDASMLTNALQTDAREVRDLLSLRMLAAFGVGVLLPGWWLWRQPVQRVRGWRPALGQLGLALTGLLLAVLLTWLAFQDLASLMRNHKSLRYMVNPFNTVYALGRVGVGSTAQAQAMLQPLGRDAHLLPQRTPAQAEDAPLVVLVVGETARAANFGLAGYGRDTTPRLRALQDQGSLVYFRDVSSCGTNTQASVPCMFSHLGKQAFEASPNRYETLLDVLQQAGLAVLWLDNQSGCKGVCDRVPNVDTRALAVQAFCEPGGECHDEVMLHELQRRLGELDPARRAKGTVVVMHQMGSHGPAYHLRTAPPHKVFQPECTSNALPNCPPEQLRNAYDNTIRYTDHFLGETVAWLETLRQPTALLYVSDHGESLGENGLYLHGMPYALAPKEQTHVPMVTWTSARWRQRNGLDLGCLRSTAQRPASHDHLFHTMLGLAGVDTAVRRAELDLISPCLHPG